MTNSNCTASSAVSENIPYPTLVPTAADYAIAEDADEYSSQPENTEPFPSSLKRFELRALQMAGFGQVGRLYQLAKLLRESEPADLTTEALASYALEIRKTANQVEDLLTDIVGPIVNDPKLEHDKSDFD